MPERFGVPFEQRKYFSEFGLALTSGRCSNTSSFLLNRALSTLSRLGVCVFGVAAPPWL
jgi:hypothetical protein